MRIKYKPSSPSWTIYQRGIWKFENRENDLDLMAIPYNVSPTSQI